jgi:glycosyltransferase involved in cell wall biosynthesis
MSDVVNVRSQSGSEARGDAGITVDPAPVELSVVMPCLNEAATLATCIGKAQHYLAESGVAGEVVVADNGSTDGSVEIAERLGARVIHVAERGYGSALRGGIDAARGRFVIIGDADDSYDFTALQPFVDELRAGYDLVMGNRFSGGIERNAMPALHRYVGNPLLSGVGRLFFKSPARDFHCGLRGFRREAVLGLDLRTTGMEFASELVVKASLQHLRVTEVPTVLSPDGRDRRPHLRTWRDGWRHLRFLVMYSPRWLFLYPGLAMLFVGLLSGGRLAFGPVRIGTVRFDVDTMLVASGLVIIGFQAVLFGLFTKVFAISEGFLPPDPRIERVCRRVTLETGLAVGALIVLAGITGCVVAIVRWSNASFGDLSLPRTIRLLCPSVTALAVGLQTIFGSFFLSILGLSRRA